MVLTGVGVGGERAVGAEGGEDGLGSALPVQSHDLAHARADPRERLVVAKRPALAGAHVADGDHAGGMRGRLPGVTGDYAITAQNNFSPIPTSTGR